MSFKKAAFGWPVYATRNLWAYMRECRQSPGARKGIAPFTATLFVVFTTGVWAALWAAVFWLLRRAAMAF
jgi:hypothetical protein